MFIYTRIHRFYWIGWMEVHNAENTLVNCMQNEYVSIDHEQVITFLFNLRHNARSQRDLIYE